MSTGNKSHGFPLGWYYESMGTDIDYLETESDEQIIDFALEYNRHKDQSHTPKDRLSCNSVTIEAPYEALYIVPFVKVNGEYKKFVGGTGFVVFPGSSHIDLGYSIDGFIIKSRAGTPYRWYSFVY